MKLRFVQFSLLVIMMLLMLSGCGLFGRGDADSPAQSAGVGAPGEETAVEAETQPVSNQAGEQPSTAETVPGENAAVVAQLPAPAIIDPPAGPNYAIGSTVQHQVESGEWLHQIARCYGTSYQELRKANSSIKHPNVILPDAKISVPNVGSTGAFTGPPCLQMHTVAAGETWFGLARDYHSKPEILAKANPGPLWAGDIIYVPSITPANTAPPSLSQSMLFNMDGDLAVWRKSDAKLELYGDANAYILDMVTNGDGRFVLVKQTRDQGETVEVAFIDRTKQTETVVETGLPPDQIDESGFTFLPTMLVSPNGEWAAYSIRENDTLRLSTFATNAPGDLKQLGGITHGVDVYGSPQLFAGGDDGHFLMSDETGVYEYPYGLDAAENQIVAIDTENFSTPDFFEAVAWSPVGSYLLLQGYFFEGAQYFVLDKESGVFTDLPRSGGYVISADASWRTDGTVLVLSPPTTNRRGPLLTTYRLDATPTTLTLRELESDELVVAGTPPVEPGYNLSLPGVQSAADAVNFTIVGGGASSGYWAVTGDSTTAERLNRVPTSAFRTYWTADGSGLLMEQAAFEQPWDLVYIAVDGRPDFSLANWLGLKINDFNWVAE